MKVILIIPPSALKKLEVVSTHYPVNLGLIAACLIEKGIEVEMWDYNVEAFNVKSFVDRIRKSSADIIGFSCMTLNIKIGNYLARLAKETSQNIFTVVAGAHSTAMPVQTLEEFQDYDTVIIGDGER